MSTAPTRIRTSRTRARLGYRRATPFASIRISPTRKTDEERRGHPRPTLVQELPEVPVRADGNDELRALLVGEEERDVFARARRAHLDVRDPEPLETGAPGRAAVGVGMEDDLGRCSSRPADQVERSVRDAVHVADHDVGHVARVDERVRAAVHPHEHGPDVADVGTERRQVLPVPVPAHHDEDVPSRERVAELREARAAEQQVALLAHVLEGVPREGFEALVHGRHAPTPSPGGSSRGPAARRRLRADPWRRSGRARGGRDRPPGSSRARGHRRRRRAAPRRPRGPSVPGSGSGR